VKQILNIVLFLIILARPVVLSQAPQQEPSRIEHNVVYGMYSGLALLMDVHYPRKPNGYGVIFISGSAFWAPLSYEATPLKELPQVQM
jgi:hypothetical protein